MGRRRRVKLDTTGVPATKQLLDGAAHLPSKKIKSLLAQGANPNAKNADGESSLLLACYRKGDDAAAQLLIESGADVNTVDEVGNTPLIVSASDDRLKLVRLLVEHRADVNAQNIEGDTPLTNAAIWGESRTVSYLLSKGADPGLPDGVGCTALDLAQEKGYSKIVRMIEAVLVPAKK